MSDEDKEPKKGEVLFPLGKQHKLNNGTVIEIRPWTIATMSRVTQRVPEAIERLMEMDKSASIVGLIPLMIDELKYVVAETLQWPIERIDEEMTLDDFLEVTELIWDHCLKGPLEKIVGLASKAGAAIVPDQAAALTQTQTTSSQGQ